LIHFLFWIYKFSLGVAISFRNSWSKRQKMVCRSILGNEKNEAVVVSLTKIGDESGKLNYGFKTFKIINE